MIQAGISPGVSSLTSALRLQARFLAGECGGRGRRQEGSEQGGGEGEAKEAGRGRGRRVGGRDGAAGSRHRVAGSDGAGFAGR